MFALRVLVSVTVISCIFSQLNTDNYVSEVFSIVLKKYTTSLKLFNLYFYKNRFFQGPFKVRWRYYDLCSGPKRENLTYMTTSLIVANEIYKGVINITFAANTRIDEVFNYHSTIGFLFRAQTNS